MLTKKNVGDILNIVATKRGRLFDSKREGKKTKDTVRDTPRGAVPDEPNVHKN